MCGSSPDRCQTCALPEWRRSNNATRVDAGVVEPATTPAPIERDQLIVVELNTGLGVTKQVVGTLMPNNTICTLNVMPGFE